MDINKINTKVLEEESTLGIYDEGNYLSITSKKNNKSRIEALAKEVRNFGIYEGQPKFLSARRKITDEEFEEQQSRLKWGLVPDPMDIGNYKDELKNIRAKGQ
jgi:hypothetical protein